MQVVPKPPMPAERTQREERRGQHLAQGSPAQGESWQGLGDSVGHGDCEDSDSGRGQGPACPISHWLWSHGAGQMERDGGEAVGLGGLATPRGQPDGLGLGGSGEGWFCPSIIPPLSQSNSWFPSSLSSSGPSFSLAVSWFLPSSKDICGTPKEPGIYQQSPTKSPLPTFLICPLFPAAPSGFLLTPCPRLLPPTPVASVLFSCSTDLCCFLRPWWHALPPWGLEAADHGLILSALPMLTWPCSLSSLAPYTVFEFMPYMGITLATIFTMLRLANEAKMRQVICGGRCLLGLPLWPRSGCPKWDWDKLVGGLLNRRCFFPNGDPISCVVWPLIHSWGWGVVRAFRRRWLSGRRSTLGLSSAGSVPSISGGGPERTMGVLEQRPGKMALQWACSSQAKDRVFLDG